MQGKNIKDFRIPDDKGDQPQNQAIEEGLAQTYVRCSSLKLSETCEVLKQKGHRVGCSDDAGEYICNYMYYKGLIACEKLCSQLTSVDGEPGSCPVAATNIETFFCHVPAFETIPEPQQQKFVVDLIAALAA